MTHHTDPAHPLVEYLAERAYRAHWNAIDPEYTPGVWPGTTADPDDWRAVARDFLNALKESAMLTRGPTYHRPDPRICHTTIPRPYDGDDETPVIVHWDYDPSEEAPTITCVEHEITGEELILTPEEEAPLLLHLHCLPIPPPLGPDPDELYDDYRERMEDLKRDRDRSSR